MSFPSTWTLETTQQLRDLWAAGHSAAEIGRRVGLSKNAVIGKAHRIGLTGRPSPIGETMAPAKVALIEHLLRNGVSALQVSKRTGAAPSSVHQVRYRIGLAAWKGTSSRGRYAAAIRDRDLFDAPDAEPVAERLPPMLWVVVPAKTYAPVKPGACCWPIGEPKAKDFRFCDDVAVAGKPYCLEHTCIAYPRYRVAA